MEKEKQVPEHIMRGAETVYTPSPVEDEAKIMQERNEEPSQSPCNFTWELCDRRG
jgi:hypothetical protein